MIFVFQANKSGKSFKVPLSTFHLNEIQYINPFIDVGLWLQCPKQVRTFTTTYAVLQHYTWDNLLCPT